MSGYDVKKYVEQSVSNFWSESFGQIYPTLRQLVRDGLAKKIATDGKGLRRRQLYAITRKGRAAVRQWLEQPAAPGPNRNELLLKLFFARQVGGAVARQHVEAFKARTAEELRHYHAIDQELRREHGDEPDLAYWRLTLEYGRLEAEAHLAWCNQAISALATIDPNAGD